MIWRSPLWMPLVWEVVAGQFGYIGLRLWKRFGRSGLLIIAALGAINILFYEEMARRVHSQQAVKDAKAACSIMVWQDEQMIDTLAAAYAETGDFNSAVQYAAQALAMKGISPETAKLFQQHLALFQQRKPIRL